MSSNPVDPDRLAALSLWADELARTFVSLTSDIALVVDGSGIITNVEQSRTEPIAPGAARWVGRPWVDTVSGETRRKIELLLQEVAATGSARRREVNHLELGGAGIPIAYTAIRLGAQGPVLAVGRDLRAIAAIQQRFLTSQQELERGYWRVREAETRERRLQQVATDALIVVDAPSLTIVQAGDTLAALCGPLAAKWPAPLAGHAVGELFDAHSRGPLDELLVTARGMARPVEIRARLAGSHGGVSVAATPFRSGDDQRLLVRLRGVGAADAAVGQGRERVAISDSSGCLLSCTPGWVEFSGALGDDALHGKAVDMSIGAAPAAFAELVARVRRDGLAEASMALRNADGARIPARISATLLTEGDQECIGFVLMPQRGAVAALRVEPAAPAAGGLDAVLEGLAGQIGQTSLRDLVREAGGRLERHLIALALERTAGDEGAAAALLGLSREGLKRRRRRDAKPPAPEGAA